MKATTAYQPALTGERRQRLDAIVARYPDRRAALLPALWLVQDAYVKGVVTFYTMYHQHPVGRHFIQVCTTTPCNLCGAEGVVEALLEHTGCGELGATSPDGRFTVAEVECLGACGFATPILVDEDFIENVTVEKVPELLKRYP
jgi:NADH:ubiquinone oxidoreductase subunit E